MTLLLPFVLAVTPPTLWYAGTDVASVFGVSDRAIYVEANTYDSVHVLPSGKRVAFPDQGDRVLGVDDHDNLVLRPYVLTESIPPARSLYTFPEWEEFRIRGSWGLGYGSDPNGPKSLYRDGGFVCLVSPPKPSRWSWIEKYTVCPADGSVAQCSIVHDHSYIDHLYVDIGRLKGHRVRFLQRRGITYGGKSFEAWMWHFEFAGPSHLVGVAIVKKPKGAVEGQIVDIDLKTFKAKYIASRSFGFSGDVQNLDNDSFCVTPRSIYYVNTGGVWRAPLPR